MTPLAILLGALLLPPVATAAATLIAPRASRLAAWLQAGGSVVSLSAAVILAARVLGTAAPLQAGRFWRIDALSALLALLVGAVAALASWLGPGLAGAPAAPTAEVRTFRLWSSLFTTTMLVAVTTSNLGVMWVAIEATTVTSALLVPLRRTKASVEASWKYLLIGSVGIALAFTGTVLAFVDFANTAPQVQDALGWAALMSAAPSLHPEVIRLAFIFLLIGFGTKAGLVPMHTWLPDAHSEAPAPLSAMMSGVLLAVALYAIARWKAIVDAALQTGFADTLLLIVALATLVVGSISLVTQSDYKRLLAYSSIEHMGLASFGLALGPAGVFASLLHLSGHALAKSAAFLLSGRVQDRYRSHEIAADVRADDDDAGHGHPAGGGRARPRGTAAVQPVPVGSPARPSRLGQRTPRHHGPRARADPGRVRIARAALARHAVRRGAGGRRPRRAADVLGAPAGGSARRPGSPGHLAAVRGAPPPHAGGGGAAAMTSPRILEGELALLPGALAPPALEHGAWRIRVAADHLVDTMRSLLVDRGATLCLMAAEDRPQDAGIHAHYLLAIGATLVHVNVALAREGAAIPTLASLSFPASRFEREMRDLVGVTPIGHPDPRPLVRHGFWPDTFFPLRKDAAPGEFSDDGRPFPFTPVEGAGVYEIPVGPVHAGVIEPGHFRFNVLGETVLKMRARLYFTHKGTEKLFEGRSPDDGVELAERISGDTSVGHSLAYCQALEALGEVDIPESARAIRSILLELERLYNHVADAGAIVADTGYPIGQAHCLRLREALLRLNRRVTGHRLLRGVVAPGGVAATVHVPDDLADHVAAIADDFEEVLGLCFENTLVRDRLEGTGRLPVEIARDFGVVGYVARACGLEIDARVDQPFAAYDSLDVHAIVEPGGDVNARLRVRVREVRQSVGIIGRALPRASGAPLRCALGPLPAFRAGFGLVEAWRGRLAHMVMTDEAGRLHRVKVVDPSFFNWPALARALRDNIVPDFPLCNKSFNQSYSGNDL